MPIRDYLHKIKYIQLWIKGNHSRNITGFVAFKHHSIFLFTSIVRYLLQSHCLRQVWESILCNFDRSISRLNAHLSKKLLPLSTFKEALRLLLSYPDEMAMKTTSSLRWQCRLHIRRETGNMKCTCKYSGDSSDFVAHFDMIENAFDVLSVSFGNKRQSS